MNVIRTARFVRTTAMVVGIFASSAVVLLAQQPAAKPATAQPVVAKLVAEPTSLTMKAGESVPFKVTAYDAAGNVITDAFVRVGGPRMAIQFGDGMAKAVTAGIFIATATAMGARDPIILEIPVNVTWPTLTKMEIVPEPGRLYTGIMLAHAAKGYHADNSERHGVAATWRSSDPAVASVDRFGNVTGNKAGTVTISAEAEGIVAKKSYTIATNPVAGIEMGIK
ncbi:MAG: Ig-like domain-containing protein, partial [Gemmatimonadota bacterium]|nr:Ig-like domain-containing protein [Gemmatimonadota bacterium]